MERKYHELLLEADLLQSRIDDRVFDYEEMHHRLDFSVPKPTPPKTYSLLESYERERLGIPFEKVTEHLPEIGTDAHKEYVRNAWANMTDEQKKEHKNFLKALRGVVKGFDYLEELKKLGKFK